MRATIPIGISPGTKLLRIERIPITNVPDGDSGTWRIWIYHNPDFTLGTYLTLYPHGGIDNTTVKEDGTEDTFQVKGSDDAN